MDMRKFIHCLSCGKTLAVKEKDLQPYCSECILDLNYRTSEINHDEIDKELQKILDFFVSDVRAAFNKDPAAQTLLEVLMSYPGIKAVLMYRIAHFFWKLRMPFIPRYLSDLARETTAIEIHPGAEIGSDFFIDHGAGVVIGETCIIGDNVTLYAGVVLGGTELERKKRHPTLGDNIVVGTGAKVLGPIKIGDNVKIGANSVVINDIPPNSVVVGVPGKIISRKGEKIDRIDLRHGDLPDPLAITLSRFEKRIKELEKRLRMVKSKEMDDIEITYGRFGGGI